MGIAASDHPELIGRHPRLALVALAALLLAGCTTMSIPPGPDPYGIKEAAVVGGDEPTRPLTPLLAVRVRLVSWNAPPSDMQPNADYLFKFPMWATVDGELRKFCQNYSAAQRPDPATLQRRLEQLLGLRAGDGHPPDGAPRLLITFEVARDKVFRPCVDPAVDTTACRADFDRKSLAETLGPVPPDPNKPDALRDPEATRFLLDQMLLSYTLHGGYPFTRRGYTYDWATDAAPGHFGLSEYVTRKETTVTIVGAPQTPAAYCAAPPAP